MAGTRLAYGDAKPGWYRAVITIGADHVPFFINLPPNDSGQNAVVINGDEKVIMDHHWGANGVEVLPRMSTESKIFAEVQKDGALVGGWSRYTGIWGRKVLPLLAKPISGPTPEERFDADPASASVPMADFSGVWRLKFKTLGPGVMKLKQTPTGVVTGYNQAKNFGDNQHIAGNVRGRKLYMSTFDGSNECTFYEFELDEDGKRIHGRSNTFDSFYEEYEGERASDFQLENTVVVKKGVDRRTLKVDSLNSPKYSGKPTIVMLFATWCPSCMDESVFLKQLYERFHGRGLEILGQTFDLVEDKAQNLEAIAKWKKITGATWEVNPRQGTPENFASLQPLPQLEHFEALPITIFIRKDGRVLSTHAGFWGPATGAEHEQLKTEFTQLVEKMLK
jgi:thiol-disulfide isomerase/thioredoxin